MGELLNCILLVDDYEAVNFVHKKIITKANITKKVVVTEDGEEAIEFLQSVKDDIELMPELIFLDINMPGMNGWKFLDSYQKLQSSLNKSIIIVMLTTSLNPDDRIRAENHPMIDEFRSKPLTSQVLQEVVSKHFKVTS